MAININDINFVISSVGSSYLNSVIPIMQGYGTTLLEYMTVISLSLFGLNIVLSGGAMTDILGQFLRQILLIFASYFFLNDGYLLIFQKGIGDTLNLVSENLLFGSSLNDTTQSFFGSSDAIMNLINQIVGENKNPLTILADFFSSVPEIATLIVLWFLMTLAGLIFFGIAVASQLLTVIALSFGPIMIPWLVFPPTQKWFDGWVNFVVGSMFWKVIGAALLGITSHLIVNFNGSLMTQIAGGLKNMPAILTSSIVLLIVIFASIFLFWQIPSLAGAITSGTGVTSFPKPMNRGQGMPKQGETPK